MPSGKRSSCLVASSLFAERRFLAFDEALNRIWLSAKFPAFARTTRKGQIEIPQYAYFDRQ
jgi:hypothetical protein